MVPVLQRKECHLKLDLGAVSASHNIWTSDISYEYVKINADYHT
ncbi:MAG: bifunctional ornithine acetyltransferase/N-acetylglutamate synthase [Lentisphaeria bacterium]|nr:bifunctional ornithine acetyltransferase/N-acetylglutamate synthase [Lentisphaeria bacterium]